MRIERRNGETSHSLNPVTVIIKCLTAAYLITGMLLLILAFILYRFGLSEKTAAIAIIIIYALVTFLAGWLSGKLINSRKFLWGFVTGVSYFLVLVILSLMMNGIPRSYPDNLLTTFLLCAGGGMLGGMLS